ncbi:zinc finger BED domain-containing protein 5-like [Sparus aurata]|uniref:zinc finger BED domain-containing protein 5-like n=1 Tax=Sparus aurata TaxID=8175 RepID=UPI0011C0EE7D|nr:zinc finger BED domain-containing protein 5-like [Sparus aurata]
MTRAMHGEKISNTLLTIPLSNDTVGRRIQDIANDIKDQLIDRVRKSGRFSLQIDECTDVSGDAQLLAFVRYSYEGKMHEDMLFCSSMEGTCTGRDIFNKLSSNIQKEGLRWESCVSVCTDGAGAMQGARKGLRACVLEVAPHVKFLHCMIYREALAGRCLEPELRDVLQTSVKIVNFIKSRPLQSRLFATLCHEMGSDHEALLFHTEVRWLSHGKVLTRLFELREEVRIFLSDCSSPLADYLTDPKWVASLAYLASILDKLNSLNLSLQGPNTNVLTLSDKVTGFKRKLERWAVSLLESFNKYFPDDDTPEKYDWICQPFTASTAHHLSSELQDALLDLSSDRTLQTAFSACTLEEFWLSVATEYAALSKAATDTYLLEVGNHLYKILFVSICLQGASSVSQTLDIPQETQIHPPREEDEAERALEAQHREADEAAQTLVLLNATSSGEVLAPAG